VEHRHPPTFVVGEVHQLGHQRQPAHYWGRGGGDHRAAPGPSAGRLLARHAKAEPKTLRYRLLHVAGRLTRGQRRVWVRIQQPWPWATDLAAGSRVALPVPAG
jgi:hypothetical protein